MALQREIRGGILEAAIQVERALDLILVNHFCDFYSERWWQLYSLVFASGDITFRRKSNIVLELLGIAYPDLLERHPGTKKALDQVVNKRNEVAHSESGMSAGFGTGQPPDHINLIVYKKGKRTVQRFTRAQAVEEVKKANELFRDLGEIAAAADPKKEEARLVAEYRAHFCSPYEAAKKAMINDVISPAETRAVVSLALRNLLSKRETRPPKKHGTIPL